MLSNFLTKCEANKEEAKISGITPDTLTFKGKKEDCPP